MKLKSIIAAVSLAFVGVACSNSSNIIAADATQQANFESNLKKLTQQENIVITSIKPTVLANVFEVLIGDAVVFTDKSGNYLIPGEIINMQTSKHLAEASLQEVANKANSKAAVLAKELDISKAIKTVKGDGSRVIKLFADPNCSYCKKLEADLAKLDNITVYTYLVAILGPDSEQKATNILCSANPAASLSAWMLDAVAPKEVANCSTSAKENLAYSLKMFVQMGLNGTPAIIFADNTIVKGYLPPEELAKNFK